MKNVIYVSDPATLNTPLEVRPAGGFANGWSYFQSFVLLLVRLSFGWVMYLSGYRHLSNVDAMIRRFNHWHIPFPTASVYISGVTEVVGGCLLVLGLASRLISIPLVFNFIVAIVTAGRLKVVQAIAGGQHLDPDSYSPGRLGGLEAVINDDAFPFLIISLVVLAFGPGKISIDHLLKRIFRKPKRVSPPPPLAPPPLAYGG